MSLGTSYETKQCLENLTLAVVKRIGSKISGAFYRSITIVYMIGSSFSFLNEIADDQRLI